MTTRPGDRIGADESVGGPIGDQARRIAECARQKEYPAKSVAAALRALEKRELFDVAQIGEIKRLTLALIAEGRSFTPVAASSERWLTEFEAARLLEIDVEELIADLETPAGLRRYGYPWSNDTRWFIAPAVVDPNRHARFFADLPATCPHDFFPAPRAVRKAS